MDKVEPMYCSRFARLNFSKFNKTAVFETSYWVHSRFQTVFVSGHEKSFFRNIFFDRLLSAINKARSNHVGRGLESSKRK